MFEWYISSHTDEDEEPFFWNNDIGWVDFFDEATLFSQEERDIFNLPIGKNVKWERCL